MLTQAPNSQRLYQQIADQIADFIRSGKFKSGTRLPTEREFAQRFAVSRPTIREALVALEIAGLVEVRTGSGAYVCPRSLRPENERVATDAGPSPFELIAARRIVEPSCAAFAAVNATKKDLAAIGDAFDLNERLFGGSHWERLEADREFHLRIAEATHNSSVVRIVSELWGGMFGRIFAVLSERTEINQKKHLTMQDHRTIFSCIERRDAAGSEAAMLTHLVHAEMKMLRSNGTSDRQKSAVRRSKR